VLKRETMGGQRTGRTETAEILLVRAIEETRADAVPAAALVDALVAAGDLDDEPRWLARRARFLLDGVLSAYRPLVDLTRALDGGAPAFLLVPFLLGLLSNYLGPSSRIHALVNPIGLLITWNVAMYVLLVVAHALGRRRRGRPLAEAIPVDGPAETGERRPTATAAAAPAVALPPSAGASLLTRWIIRRVVPGVWLAVGRGAGEIRRHVGGTAAVARAFWAHWLAAARPALVLGARRAFHLAAMGLAAGAMAGMYARGLFFDYTVVWRSTFLRDPDLVAVVLSALFGPAAVCLGEPLPDAAEAARLMTAEGAPAARWIHLYAVSAALLIVGPRLLLAIATSARRRALARRIAPDLGAEYYQGLLATARALQVRRVADAIAEDVRRECKAFAERVAAFVCEELYDARIVPRLETFRGEGGTIAALEETIAKECQVFEPKLARHLPLAQQDFERSLSRSIARTIGADLALLTVPAGAIATGVGAVAAGTPAQVAGRLGHRLADVLSGAVSGAVAIVAATLSGGLGETLGTAILVGLLGTTGPVGFVIGGIGALVLAGGTWWLGRDALAGRFKRMRLPALVARTALVRLDALVASGRTRCRTAVEEVIGRELEPLTPRIAAQIWESVKPLLGEQHRLHGRAPAATETGG
jgi:hypothetical protein